MAKTTTELLKELKRQSCSLPDYLSNHKDTFVNEDIKAFWENIIESKKDNKILVVRSFLYKERIKGILTISNETDFTSPNLIHK